MLFILFCSAVHDSLDSIRTRHCSRIASSQESFQTKFHHCWFWLPYVDFTICCLNFNTCHSPRMCRTRIINTGPSSSEFFPPIHKVSSLLRYRRSWDVSVGIATGYGLDCRVSSPGMTDFSLLHSVQTGSVAHPAYYPMGTVGSFLWGKAARKWGWPFTSS
jgi:hypothetical protein